MVQASIHHDVRIQKHCVAEEECNASSMPDNHEAIGLDIIEDEMLLPQRIRMLSDEKE